MNTVYSSRLDSIDAEPIDLATAKAWLKVDFSTDDTLITALISVARDQVEQYTGCTLGNRTVYTIVQMDGIKGFELPFGPVQSITSVEQVGILGGDATVITSYTEIGGAGDFVNINTGRCGQFIIEYSVGWDTLPAALRDAVLFQLTYLYEHRGDEDIEGFSSTAKLACKGYRRVPV